MRQLVEFKERQGLAPWVFILIGLFSIGGIAIAIVQIGTGRPVGDHPMSNVGLLIFVAIFSLGFPALLGSMKLDIETTFEGLHVRYGIFLNRWIRYDEIESAVAKTYSPLKEYGGWGIRGFGKRVAYNARGNQGVFLTLKNGATIMLGTQRPAELEAAIRSGLKG